MRIDTRNRPSTLASPVQRFGGEDTNVRTSSRQFIVAACLATTASIPAPGLAQTRQSADPFDTFTAAADEYAQLHRRIELALGPVEITAVAKEIQDNVDAMSAAIRAERPLVRQGDLFTPKLSGVLRQRIAGALAAQGLTAADVATDEIPEGVSRQSLVLAVGRKFPWIVGSTTLPCILEVLPRLPRELQYRFVFRDLAIVDVHANLVVDILPNAIPATEF